MNAEIISIGSELMAGRIADTNAAYLSDQLQRIGFKVTRHTAVGDCHADIVATARAAAERARIVVITGGIGPTPDDLTRQAMAEFSGRALVENPEGVANLRRIFARFGRPVSPSNYVQARIPRGADLLPNQHGTASGFCLVHGECRFYVMPGVPAEMEQMFRESVLPALLRMSPGVTVVRCLQVYGLGESVIGERLKHLMGEKLNPEVATQANEGIITVRLTATASSEKAAERLLTSIEEDVRNHLGSAVFDGDGRPIEAVVAELLEQAGLTLALAESCTGGEIAARLTDIPGVSRVFMEGEIAYSNSAKIARLGVPAAMIERYGAVSAEVAATMAAAMREASDADIALSVTGLAGPGGGTPEKPIGLVYLALADAAGTYTEEARFSGDRVKIRNRAAKRALNKLRIYLLDRKQTN